MDENNNLRAVVMAQQSYIKCVEKNVYMYKKILLNSINNVSINIEDNISTTCINLGTDLLKLFYNFDKKELYSDVTVNFKPSNDDVTSSDELRREFLELLLEASEIEDTNEKIEVILQTFYDYRPSINGIIIRFAIDQYKTDLGCCFIRLNCVWWDCGNIKISMKFIDSCIYLYNYLINMDRISSIRDPVIVLNYKLDTPPNISGKFYYYPIE